MLKSSLKAAMGSLAPLFLAALCLGGCKSSPLDYGEFDWDVKPKPDYARPLGAHELALRKITDPREIPDFTQACANRDNLDAAIQHSLDYLAKPSSKKLFPCGEISHEKTVASLRAFQRLLEQKLAPEPMNDYIRRHFDVYASVGWNGEGGVLFTGYYTPIFDGSLTPDAKFRYPLYKRPDGLVKGPDGSPIGIRQENGEIAPAPPRAEIHASGALKGRELLYLADPFDAYIAHVEGSARVRLADGRLITAAYDANNGWDYQSLAEMLTADGKMLAQDVSLPTIRAYFQNHPEELESYANRNPRFIFFRDSGDEAPRGCLNTPLTPMYSIATDKNIFPRAALTFFFVNLPTRGPDSSIINAPYAGFALDQDAGGAIRAPGRCDLYMGIGDEAGELAGRAKQEGRLYYLFIK